MPGDQLTPDALALQITGGCGLAAPPRRCLTRREFLIASAAGGAGTLLACSGLHEITNPGLTTGTIVGDVVNELGTPQAGLGKIYLMYENGLQTGRSATVDASGKFTFADVPEGSWQVRFYAPGVAYVSEDLANPLPVQIKAGQTLSVHFEIELGWEDGAPMIEIYIGDYFFQEQPLGAPNAETAVKVGVPICWYNVGLMQHTTTGGFWDSGPLNK
ncbi:MAG TPA: carboxypeptidase-like regulatory domain-containing protein, partial [Gemmatimonadaceae bacterium]|nr:carboxypeptidase-like regulatory domain-containing protein [Gemmatimonadaceae bacterium]